MSIVDGIDLTPSQGLSIHEIQDILPMGEGKEKLMILMVYILLLRSNSKVADLKPIKKLNYKSLTVSFFPSTMILSPTWTTSAPMVSELFTSSYETDTIDVSERFMVIA